MKLRCMLSGDLTVNADFPQAAIYSEEEDESFEKEPTVKRGYESF